MANVVSASNVTIVRAWTEGGVSGKERKGMVVRIAGEIAALGGTTNTIPASAFGLSVIESCSNGINTVISTGVVNRGEILVPSADGAYLHGIVITYDEGPPIAIDQAIGDFALPTDEQLTFEIHGY
jgi:hypothetical protein